jgi:hypothetical protein
MNEGSVIKDSLMIEYIYRWLVNNYTRMIRMYYASFSKYAAALCHSRERLGRKIVP